MASEVRRLTKALVFAAEAHRNQRRKGASQEPYINHLIEVLDLVASVDSSDMDVLIAALLHDVIEDTGTGYDELVAMFGERVARIVRENSDDMTLPKPERRRARLAGIGRKSREARLVKFADIISNLRAIAIAPPAGWSNDHRLGYLESCRNLVDGGRGSMLRSNASLTRPQRQWSSRSGAKALAISMAGRQQGASSKLP
jgi:(p)ppGpp synthase/HD superfamily hydrolase